MTVLSGDGVYSVSIGGKLISEYHFEEKNIKAFDLSDDGCAVVLKGNRSVDDQQAVIFDKRGGIKHHSIVDQTVKSIVEKNGNVYLMCADGLLRIQGADGQETFIKCVTEGRVLLVTDEERVLLCSPQKATYENFT